MNSTALAIIFSIVILTILTFIKKGSKHSDFGINLKRNYCSNCNEKQPIVRTPANLKEALFGGSTCKKCGTKMDKYGEEIINKGN